MSGAHCRLILKEREDNSSQRVCKRKDREEDKARVGEKTNGRLVGAAETSIELAQ